MPYSIYSAGALIVISSLGEEGLQLSQSSSVAQSCLTLCDPRDRSTPCLPVHIANSCSLLKLMSTESVMPSNHLILCRPLL